MFRKIALTATATTATIAAVAVKKSNSKPECHDELEHFKCKPTDLPLYEPLHAQNKPAYKLDEIVTHPPKNSQLRETIECGVCVVRTQVQAGCGVVSRQTDNLVVYYDTGKAHLLSSVDYLNQPHNVLPRSGAIVVGGLAGFIFAARGGFIKKLLYTGIGAGTIASICYPRQAEAFARDALHEARRGYAVAYNFVKGAKPGDEVAVDSISKFPTNLEDVKFLFLDLYDEAKEAVFPKK